MNTGSAYILGTINSAVFFKDKKAKIFYGDTSRISDIDGYIWSQICSIKPEYKKAEFDSIDSLLKQTNDDSKKHEALELSLELMDTNLSEEYRLGISKILGDLLNDDQELIPFILNRLYSTPVPDTFNEEQALKTLLPLSSKAGDFYQDLKTKTALFSHFYTLLKLELELEPETQDLVDQVLTDSGCYPKFTISLYEHSKKKYDSAIFDALKKLNELKISYSPDVFFVVEEKLKTNYEISLNNKDLKSSSSSKIDVPNFAANEESDTIIDLIESYFYKKQTEHDLKRSKRDFKIRRNATDALDIVENIIDWSKKFAQKNDAAFLHSFGQVLAKQLLVSKPEQLCKTCCYLASYFTQLNRFNLANKLLVYAKRLNPEDKVIYTQEAEIYKKAGDLIRSLELYNLAISKFSDDIYPYCGKADVLKDLGKFDEALLLYNSTIKRFGYNIVAYNGKAEVLKDLGKFDEAFKIYEGILQKNPDNRVSQTGRLKLLLETNKLEQNLNLLIKSNYISYDDYFDLHIYCMFLIKNGDWNEALNMINLGLKSPYPENSTYFKSAAFYLKILQKQYNAALSYFNSTELNRPILNLLATHAFAATNQINRAKEVLHKLDFIELPVIKITTSYLSERYTLNGYKKSGKSIDELDTLILEGEMKALLQL